MDKKKKQYNEYLESKIWKTKRNRILKRDGYTCQICGKMFPKNKLHVHHMSYRNFGKEQDCELVTLCKKCHYEYHRVNKLKRIYFSEYYNIYSRCFNKTMDKFLLPELNPKTKDDQFQDRINKQNKNLSRYNNNISSQFTGNKVKMVCRHKYTLPKRKVVKDKNKQELNMLQPSVDEIIDICKKNRFSNIYTSDAIDKLK